MANNSKKILVTGAAGLIGRELFFQLQQLGLNVIGIDNCSRFPAYKPDGNFIKSDIEDFLKSSKNDFDVIYHMAAINGTKFFYEVPNKVLKNNVQLDLSIFSYVEQNPKCKLVYASSSEVVADTENFPTSEETDILIKDIHNPRWSYRLPKILSENYLSNSKIDYTIVRFFNVFSEHSGHGHFVKDIASKIKNKEFDLIGSNETRSFCYVSDAVEALIHVSNMNYKGVVNIGSDEEITVSQAANIIAQSLNVFDISWNHLPSRQGSVQRRRPDLEILKKLHPKFNPLKFNDAIKKIKDKL